MSAFVNTLNGYLWGPIMIVLCLGVAIIYSVVLKFPQIRLFKNMVHYLTKGSSSENGISSFQGFAMALGGRVGVGNIAGVATAIFYGGPGALFWMWIYALLGAASAFAESTAGQIWKTEDNGEYCGGPAQYIARGLRCKPLAILYALAAVLAFGLTGPTVQSYNIADSMRNAFNVPPLVTGIIVAILFAAIVAGGAKRIGSFASYVVPFMAGVYIVLMIVIGCCIGSGLFGWIVGFYPVESAITAGLCMANMGGAGDLAVLGAAKRMDLMVYAQISSRIGGAMVLLIASILFAFL